MSLPMSSKTRTFQGSPFSFRIAGCGASPFDAASCGELAGSATSLFKLRTLSIACICRSLRDCILRAIGLANGNRGRSNGSEVNAIKKKNSAEVMHAQRPAHIGNRGAKDMLALEDLRKLFHLIRNSGNFFGRRSQAFGRRPGALGAVFR
jgi:hypothetical protein